MSTHGQEIEPARAELFRMTLPDRGAAKPQWSLYGRVYVVNFRETQEGATIITWRRTGPSIGGGARIYIAIRKTF